VLHRQRLTQVGQDATHALILLPALWDDASKQAQEDGMKQFRCGDVVLGCEWVARNDDEGVLFQDIQAHARDAHGMDEVPPEVVEQIQQVITEI